MGSVPKGVATSFLLEEPSKTPVWLPCSGHVQEQKRPTPRLADDNPAPLELVEAGPRVFPFGCLSWWTFETSGLIVCRGSVTPPRAGGGMVPSSALHGDLNVPSLHDP